MVHEFTLPRFDLLERNNFLFNSFTVDVAVVSSSSSASNFDCNDCNLIHVDTSLSLASWRAD